MHSPTSPKLRWLIRFSAIGTLIFLITQLFPSEVSLFLLLEPFLIQTLIGSIIFLAIALGIKERLSAGTFTIVVAIILIKAFPYYWPMGSEIGKNPDLTIGHYNLWHDNENPTKAIQVIVNQNTDIIGIQELNTDWINELALLEDTYPYSVAVPHDSCCYGIGLYSKYPITAESVVDVGYTPSIAVTIELNGRDVNLLYLHTRPPAFPDETLVRNNQLKLMSQRVSNMSSDWLLVGDFNIVPWAKEFQKLLETSEGKDARRGFHATFPADYVSLIPIDHVIHSSNLECTGFETVILEGSDHKGLKAGFRFN